MKPRLPTAQLVRIVLTIALLVAIIVMKQRCGSVTADLFRAIDARPDGGAKALTPLDAAH